MAAPTIRSYPGIPTIHGRNTRGGGGKERLAKYKRSKNG